MADINELAALLHVHKGLLEHGDAFPNLRSHVMDALRKIEAEHAPQKQAVVPVEEAEPVEEEEPSDA